MFEAQLTVALFASAAIAIIALVIASFAWVDALCVPKRNKYKRKDKVADAKELSVIIASIMAVAPLVILAAVVTGQQFAGF